MEIWEELKEFVANEVNKYQDEKTLEEELRESEACHIFIKMLDLEAREN